MNQQLIVNALVLVVLVGLIGVRQLSWRPVSLARMWRMPLILAGVGVVNVAETLGTRVLSGLDVSVLVIEVVLSLGVGAAMGAIAHFRLAGQTSKQSSTPTSSNDQAPAALFESRTGWWGLALWVLFIAVRIGFDVWSGQLGSTLASSTGVILILIGANRAARVAVFAARIGRLAPEDGVGSKVDQPYRAAEDGSRAGQPKNAAE